jgi:hypothetical protein
MRTTADLLQLLRSGFLGDVLVFVGVLANFEGD